MGIISDLTPTIHTYNHIIVLSLEMCGRYPTPNEVEQHSLDLDTPAWLPTEAISGPQFSSEIFGIIKLTRKLSELWHHYYSLV